MIKQPLTTQVGKRVAGLVEEVRNLIGPGQWFLAGGSVREAFFGLPVSNDLDVYFLSEAALAEANALMMINHPIDHFTQNSTCYSTSERKVDLIKNVQESMAACLYGFDFTCCQWAADSNGLILTEAALADCLDRRLSLANPQNAAATLMRVPKYLAKGFTADVRLMHQLTTAVQRMTAADIPELKEGLSSQGPKPAKVQQDESRRRVPLVDADDGPAEDRYRDYPQI
jgi:hypothetical protein